MKLATALTIAGTDPTGGAGIMADLKSFTARGVYGMAVVTSVVAQNTMGVRTIENISLDMLEAQLKAVYDDISPMAVKTGMLATADMMRVIKPFLSRATPYVMDPVMVATSGDALIDEEARHHLISELMPLATLVTPNLPEAEFLVGRKLTTEADIDKAAHEILTEMGPKAVIIKGGHIGADATDYLYVKGEERRTWTSPKFDTPHTHGTGCTFSAVIAAELAKGKSIAEAVAVGKAFITTAIKENPGLGKGHGPVNHMAYHE
ncbi:bifunctional hydroxymethylpyrimidine kinase/phosphomethylpyrimidine kinase [uncultured Veillonella sp.]|uniref:bifunctional hydroxymethylpyrimidine kinase/phosphomethylpyrimidine kinase n=1 Tax=uncultured Veillonella sp. TaxID=159268 RepID=UPI002590723D|nr:bifunctional hydroxymethylpyrimidine kinase/phosphomethylpyrimidine kinase [uncultured Veillonella sp.]